MHSQTFTCPSLLRHLQLKSLDVIFIQEHALLPGDK